MHKKFSRRRCLITAASAIILPKAIFYNACHFLKKIGVPDSEISPEIVTQPCPKDKSQEKKQSSESQKKNIEIEDINLKGQHFKLAGVLHTRKVMETHFNELENLVKNAGSVVSEASPEDMKSDYVSNNAKAYFGTVLYLCKKYDKPVITLDSFSRKASRIERETSFLGHSMVLYPSFKGLQTRRMKLADLLLLITGFCTVRLSNPSHNHTFNHTIDQRNIELLKRLEFVYGGTDRFRGNYSLVNFGRKHTRGVKYYSEHTFHRKIKEFLYKGSFNLLDNDEIALYRWSKTTNSWDKQVIRK